MGQHAEYHWNQAGMLTCMDRHGTAATFATSTNKLTQVYDGTGLLVKAVTEPTATHHPTTFFAY